MKPKIFSVIFCTLLFICEIFSQGIPQTINFQGVLKDASGNIVSNGEYNLTFKIYNVETGGTSLWTETKLVNVVDGIFSTQLGSVTPITLPFDAAYWLGIAVGGGSELTPRVAFSSVPYSRMSLSVPDNSLIASKIHSGQVVKSINGLKDSINLVAGSNVTIMPSGNDLTISAASGAGGTVTQVNTGAGLTGGPITTTGTISIANDGITNAMLQNNSVTSTKIADGSVFATDLSDSSVTSAKIVDGTVSTSDLANNSVTTDKIVEGTITATDIANTQVVKSINSLKDNVNLVAGSNVTITPSGNDLTISATGSGGIGGSGIINTIPIFKDTTTLGYSGIYKYSNGIQYNGEHNALDGIFVNSKKNAYTTGFGYMRHDSTKILTILDLNDKLITARFNDYGYWDFNFAIDKYGNIGIGNVEPKAKVDILGGNWDLLNTEGDFKIGNETIRLKIGVPTGGAGAGNNTIVSQGGGNRLILGAGNSWDEFNTLTIYNKNVGIGTTSPQYPLHISTKRKYAGYFTTDTVHNDAHVLHAEYTGSEVFVDARALFALSAPSPGFGIGGEFIGGYKGLEVLNPAGDATIGYGISSTTFSSSGGIRYAIYLRASGGYAGKRYGIYTEAFDGEENYGIYSYTIPGVKNWAGYFRGNVNITGTLSKGGGSFKIDHPLDPQNKYLYHSFVESPDMMNIYNGNVVTDASGYATVTLPDWFEALNKDFRYQLTVIGDFAQAIVAQEIQNNQFTIRTDKPNVKVSWQVTGIRHDPFAEKNRIPVEEYKRGDDVGKYLHPEAYSLPETMGIDYKYRAELEKREKEK